MTYYHGGKGGLRVGMFILPPALTGAASTASYGAEKVCRRDRVYVTTSDAAALLFGALHYSMKGCVYEVEPIGELVTDPDANADADGAFISFECERARILKVRRIYPSVRDDILKSILSAQRPD
jgi:hypothetical protein